MAQTTVESYTGPSPKELARKHGLGAAGRLPSLLEYTRQLWGYRHFIWEFAGAKVSAALGNTRLGMLWQVLTPLFNAGVYYVIFGLLLDTSHRTPNFVTYLCIGVFIFGYTQTVVQAGILSVSGNLGLIRALHFPRASLPISITLVEARNMIVSMAVLMTIVLVTGEPLTLQWLLIVPALILQTIFNAGFAMLVGRLGSTLHDLRQLVPFIMRVWMYGSAVLYPVQQFTAHLHGWKLNLVLANPMLVFIELMRHALMENVQLAGTPMRLWTEAIIWTAVMGIGGYAYFWRGEKGYGRG
ncbi:ABC transporter permease [Actinoplanes sp. KI2]|uniref:ABC transporter permease n=1 Tax=Actinoplanes sp. KI2 TaxID=2983315 RepID=UPI0021D56DFC|nr:ABC transporter permease [Actinoplanes sp. KI2]MCU7724231.1 ABC transporter permease [Actinoplanes sp. KI2]